MLDVDNTALMLMDYQEAICRPEGSIGQRGIGAEVERRDVLTSAKRVLDAFREAEGRVIHVRVGFDDEYHRMTSASKGFAGMKRHRMMLDSDEESNICSEVAPVPGELVVTKGCTNAFIGTNLTEKLIGFGAKKLVLGGVATNHVVETSARYATDTGFDVTVLEDLCASGSQELHEFAISQILPGYAKILSSEDFLSRAG